jgi:hypothetical protein
MIRFAWFDIWGAIQSFRSSIYYLAKLIAAEASRHLWSGQGTHP